VHFGGLLKKVINAYNVLSTGHLRKYGGPHTTHHWSVPKHILTGYHTVYNWRENNCCLFW